MVLDFHSHAFPDSLAAHAIKNLEELGDIPAYTDGTVSGLKRSMKQAGITHGTICNIVVKPGQTAKVHEFATSLLTQEKEPMPKGTPHVIPLASVHPKEPHWKEWLATIKNHGFAGIKLHPGYQQFFINDPSLEPFYKEAFRQGLFLMFHAGWDAGYPDPMHASPQRVYDILPVLEQGTTVLAHLGGNMRPKEVRKLLCGRNVYFDTAYSLDKIPLEEARGIVKEHGPERMLFGSDAPWASQSVYTDYFFNTFAPGFLSPADTEKIAWSNGAKLLGIL